MRSHRLTRSKGNMLRSTKEKPKLMTNRPNLQRSKEKQVLRCRLEESILTLAKIKRCRLRIILPVICG